MSPGRNRDGEVKTAALLQEMTLEEKIGQMVYINFGYQEPVDAVRAGKVGMIANIEDAERMNRLQRIAVEESRLGIPILFGNDVIHGFRTIFPIPLAEACSWEPELWKRTAALAAEEASQAGTQLIFGPMVDVTREPRWGRIAEGPGEDPFLAGIFSEAKVKGFQSSPWEGRAAMAACAKHFVAYGAVEGGRDYDAVDISRQMLADVYLPPFRKAVEAGVQMVMSAFNDFNGIPVTANAHLQQDVLRKSLGFDGLIISDDKTISKLIPQGLAADGREACEKAVLAGTDIDMNSGIYLEYLVDLVRSGQIPEAIIDQAAARVLRLKLENGLFDLPYVEAKAVKESEIAESMMATAREAAAKSIVLLKNEANLLPLTAQTKSLAVIGPLAVEKNVLGCWSCYGDPAEAVTVLDGIRAQAGAGIDVRYAKGCSSVTGMEMDAFIEAIRIAEEAELAVVVVGEEASMSGEGMCRSALGLPGVQQELVQAIYTTGTPVIVILINGRPLAIEWIADHIPAIIEAWFPGSQAGHALADVLFGRINPSGKLSITFPRSVGQIPIYYNQKRSGRPDEQGKRFATRYMDIPSNPLYPFGYGLSYTEFSYRRLKITPENLRAAEILSITVEVRNSGRYRGEEIVQLYLQDVSAGISRPCKELRGFQKIVLEPGEKRAVEFLVPGDSLGFYNAALEYCVEPGWFRIWVGPNSAEGLEGQFRLVD